MAAGAAVAASSAALAIEMLVAAVKTVPAARSVPANKMRVDFMFRLRCCGRRCTALS
jgi:hypothetical protein